VAGRRWATVAVGSHLGFQLGCRDHPREPTGMQPVCKRPRADIFGCVYGRERSSSWLGLAPSRPMMATHLLPRLDGPPSLADVPEKSRDRERIAVRLGITLSNKRSRKNAHGAAWAAARHIVAAVMAGHSE
jgi:hypothetical protein